MVETWDLHWDFAAVVHTSWIGSGRNFGPRDFIPLLIPIPAGQEIANKISVSTCEINPLHATVEVSLRIIAPAARAFKITADRIRVRRLNGAPTIFRPRTRLPNGGHANVLTDETFWFPDDISQASGVGNDERVSKREGFQITQSFCRKQRQQREGDERKRGETNSFYKMNYNLNAFCRTGIIKVRDTLHTRAGARDSTKYFWKAKVKTLETSM